MSRAFAKAYGIKQAERYIMTKLEYDIFEYGVLQNSEYICPVCFRKLDREKYEAAHIQARCHFGDQQPKQIVRCAIHATCNNIMLDRTLQVNTSDARFFIQHLD